MKNKYTNFGFTLVELLVVVSVISILAAIVYANFGGARASSRDDVRKSALKEVQLALELYKAQYGMYPAQACGDASTAWAGPGPHSVFGCTAEEYIVGLAPEFIAALPKDPKNEYDSNSGFRYGSNGTDYKLIVGPAEVKIVGSYNDEFARCPALGAPGCAAATPQNMYSVYSAGAAQW